MSPHQFIPGMRVEIRDAEWRIQRADRSTDGGYLLSCVGLSEVVRGLSALFLTALEKALFSSPAACLSTIENRLARLRKRESNSEILADIGTFEGLGLALRAIRPESFSKYQLLLDLLRPVAPAISAGGRTTPKIAS